jgi:repressor LexA
MLTPRQRAAYDFVVRFSRRNGYAPSYDEIRRHLGLASLNAVAKLVAQLRRRGYLVEAPRNAKRWLAAAPGRETVADTVARPHETRHARSTRPESATLPLLGMIAAGRPIEAIETPEEIEVPASLLGPGARYTLRVRGDSMIEEGIQDGDVVVVRSARRAENGQTVVAIVDGEATLKRFHREGPAARWVELRPANAAMKPIRVAADRVEIRGVLVGLLRRYV